VRTRCVQTKDLPFPANRSQSAVELNNLNRVRAHKPTVRKMKDLYARCDDYSGKECRVAVPAEWRLSAAESRRLTVRQQRATKSYFGN